MRLNVAPAAVRRPARAGAGKGEAQFKSYGLADASGIHGLSTNPEFRN